jgi:hypothetical protein
MHTIRRLAPAIITAVAVMASAATAQATVIKRTETINCTATLSLSAGSASSCTLTPLDCPQGAILCSFSGAINVSGEPGTGGELTATDSADPGQTSTLAECDTNPTSCSASFGPSGVSYPTADQEMTGTCALLGAFIPNNTITCSESMTTEVYKVNRL